MRISTGFGFAKMHNKFGTSNAYTVSVLQYAGIALQKFAIHVRTV